MVFRGEIFRFIILTAVRSGEARGATWKEIDRRAAEWRIPAERMKGGARAQSAVVACCDGHAGACQEPPQSCRLVLPGPDARQPSDARDDAGAGLETALWKPMHGPRLPLLVPPLGERADQRAACRGRGGAGAPSRKRRRAIVRPVGPVRQALLPDGWLGGVCDEVSCGRFGSTEQENLLAHSLLLCAGSRLCLHGFAFQFIQGRTILPFPLLPSIACAAQ